MKKTKIVATMSDFRCTEEFVKNLFDAGMDVVRVNSAHVSEEGATHIVETVHRVNPAIPIMIDTKGPEIRVTTIADEYGNSINFRVGDRVAVRGSDGSDMTTRKVVYMNVPTIVRDIPVGARMLIADGELEIRVVEKTDEELAAEKDDAAVLLGLLTPDQWRDVLKVDGRGVLLDIAAKGGWHNVQRYLWLIEGAREGVQIDPEILTEARQLLTS